jgi:hypothetical protein
MSVERRVQNWNEERKIESLEKNLLQVYENI